MKKENILVNKSFEFAVGIVNFCESQKYSVLINQLLKSGTSVGANISESQHAQSKRDFLARLYISHKECYETLYRLALFKRTTHKKETISINKLISECIELKKIMTAIIKTTKKNLDKNS